jgi:hypothetical protein
MEMLEPTQVQIPMDIIDQTQTFDPDDDDAIMKDIESPQIKAKAPRKPRVPHASEILKIVDPYRILDKTLNAPTMLSVREIIGVSKEVSGLMQDATRYR